MPSKWIWCIRKGQVGTRWSLREKTDRQDPEDKSCNAGTSDYDLQLHAKFSTERTKEDWPFSVQRVRLPSVSTGAR